MKRNSTLFLKVVLWLIGLAVIGLCIFCTVVLVRDVEHLLLPALLGVYGSATPFFIALYQALQLLRNIDQSRAFSESSVKALRNIKYCALAIGAVYTASMPLVFYVADTDDAPGGVGIGLLFIFAALVVATFAAVLQKLIQDGMAIKSENDLTV